MPTINYVKVYAAGTILTPEFFPTPDSVSIGPSGGQIYGTTASPNIIRIEPYNTGSDARVEGIENEPTTGRDQLNLVNCRITLLDSAYANQYIAIEFEGVFGPVPDGNQNFSGYLTGAYKRGGSPIPGVCYSKSEGRITKAGGSPKSFTPKTGNLANFNLQFTPIPVDMGQNNNRTHYMKTTFKFPQQNDYVELNAGGRVTYHGRGGPKKPRRKRK